MPLLCGAHETQEDGGEMYVLYGKFHLYMPYAASLKDKRQIIQSLVARIRKRFSISITEVAGHDLWQTSQIGFAAVCGTYGETQIILDAVQRSLDQYDDRCHITDFDYETINYD